MRLGVTRTKKHHPNGWWENFIEDENTHPLRLESELSDLRAGYANPVLKIFVFQNGVDCGIAAAKKTGHQSVSCRGGISSRMNIPTPYALKASFQIYGWGMRTPAPSVRCSMRLGDAKEKKTGHRLVSCLLW